MSTCPKTSSERTSNREEEDACEGDADEEEAVEEDAREEERHEVLVPYKSSKQRKYMHAKKPKIAKRWDKEIHDSKKRKK